MNFHHSNWEIDIVQRDVYLVDQTEGPGLNSES